MITPARMRRAVLLCAITALTGGVAGQTSPSAAAPEAGVAPAPIEQPASVTRPARRLRHAGLFPMDPEPTCYILNNFGDSRGNGTRSHEGVDIMATSGQEVYALVDGKLTRQASVDASLSGNAWGMTATSDGTYYFYAHLSGFAEGLKVGDTVTQGQVIGSVGDTGNAGPNNFHLHFEIHPGGQLKPAVDPVPRLVIPPACTLAKKT